MIAPDDDISVQPNLTSFADHRNSLPNFREVCPIEAAIAPLVLTNTSLHVFIFVSLELILNCPLTIAIVILPLPGAIVNVLF